MSVPVYLIDAFAQAPFAGNPAAVCLLDGSRESGWMQAVAAEMNQAETAFVHRTPGSRGWSLRWFTPRVEVDLCGHATLAAAHVLWQSGQAADEALAFATRSGRLIARREGGAICLDFPADPPVQSEAPPSLDRALGISPLWAGRSTAGWLAVLEDERQVRRLTPDPAALAALEGDLCMVTARSDGPAFDFVSRVFGPRVGIFEDAVTGVAHCVLGPYWSARLGKAELNAYQASSRGGIVGVRLAGARVKLIGQAVTVFQGIMHV